jgi:hypothetical protein
LVDDYFALWKTTDDDERHALVQKIFTESAVHYAAPANVSFSGIDEIEANIARINKENIQQAGLQFHPGDSAPNHNSVQLQWTVADPSGKTLGTGRDFLLLDDDGRVKALYMFTG